VTLSVFDNIERHDNSPARFGEGGFAFLNRVEGAFWDRTRGTVELWVSHVDENSRTDLVARLRSNDDGESMAAYWELYLHESLRRQNFRLTPHVELGDTRARPDLLAKREDVTFLLEATRAGDPKVETAAAHRREAVYDVLNELDSPDFFLWVHVEEEAEVSPPARRMRESVAGWLTGLDYEAVSRVFEVEGLDALPTHSWQGDGWRVTFRPIAKGEARGQPGLRPLGIFEVGGARAVDDVGQVRRNLEGKAGRYGRPDIPLVLALAVDSVFFDPEHTMSQALFGRHAVQWDPQTLEAAEGRLPDGLWQGPRGPRNTRVSAVLAVGNVRPYHFTNREPVLWHNPWADKRMPDVLQWESVSDDPATRELVRRPARQRCYEMLGVPEGWPGPEDPFPGH
jgi:hypothetical protein